jgi:predicted nucleic acid-binding protein
VTFVLDASMALAWCFDDERSDRTDRVLGRLPADDALTPAIWPLEVANALRTAERRGRLGPGELATAAGLLLGLPIRVEAIGAAEALGGIADLARSLDLSVYDAAYLHLAITRGLPLATADERLRRACTEAGVELVG